MPKIVYPRPCPDCGTKINDRRNFSRHRKYCGRKTREPCLHCDKTFCRKDKLNAHVRKCHPDVSDGNSGKKRMRETVEPSPASKKPRTSDDCQNKTAESSPARKKPRTSDDQQIGGAVESRGSKRPASEKEQSQRKPSKTPKKKTKERVVSESSDEESDVADEEPKHLFEAKISKMGTPKKWKKGKVIDQKFTFTLESMRPPKPEDDLGVEAVAAITQGMDKMIKDIKINPKEYDMALQIGSSEHPKEMGNTGETWHVPVNDYLQRTQLTQSLLGHVARVLNSAEFISSGRGFSATMTLIHNEVKGGKRTGYKPGAKIWQEVVKELRSVCEITNKDELCCGRAIVVMREYAKKQAGEKNTYENIRQDRGENSQQKKEAKKLYKEAGVPEGVCGYEEIQKFQDYLGPQGYQLIVLDPVRCGIIFTGAQYKFAPKVIQLVKTYHEDENGETKAHYDGARSIAPIMNRCKFCRYCCKGYNSEDSKHHHCLFANCPCCERKNNGCKDYTNGCMLTITCLHCCRSFYGEDCYQDHLMKKEQEESPMEKKLINEVAKENHLSIPPQKRMKSMCEMYRYCHTCSISYKIKGGAPHQCGHGQCSNCLEFVDLYNHKCSIMSDIYKANKKSEMQEKAETKIREAIKEMTTLNGEKVKDVATRPITMKEKETARLKWLSPRQRTPEEKQAIIDAVKRELQELGVNVAEIADDKIEDFQEAHFGDIKERESELVFAEIECSIDDSRVFTPNLICFERESSDVKDQCWGKTCLKEFYQKLNDLIPVVAEEQKKQPQHVVIQVYFHNLRGFDGMFIIKQLFDMNVKVEKILMTGQKIIYFECDQFKFKDSLSFLNMPLEKFTETFGLTELKKGFFPHAFNKVQNQDYDAPIPDIKHYI